jgi:hypothetical protein
VLDGHPGGADRGGGDQPRVQVVLEVGADPPGDPFRKALLDHHDGLELFGGQGGRGCDPSRLAQVDCFGGEAVDDRVDHRRPQRLIRRPLRERGLHPRRAVVGGRQECRVLVGEVVVERAGRHARLGGDVLDPDLLPALLHGQTQGGQAQRLAGGLPFALAQAQLVGHDRQTRTSCRPMQVF